MQQTRKAPKVAKFKGKSELRGGLNVEGNISPRAILTKDGVKKVDVKTASALLELGSIIDLGKGVFLDADIAASAFGGEVGDEFRYGDIGLDEVGIGIGKKVGESGQIGLKGTYRPGRGGQDDDYTAGLTFSSKFNKGGAVNMQQMEMFKEGGLKDEGGTKDPVSGNDVPSGSLKEEVRDDIDAKLSPGEFVFPADVVRFIGLQKLMQMRDKAKAGLQRMEDMGQMGNSDEAIIDDDVPFGTTDLIIMAGPSDNEMNQGGMPTVPGQGRFDQLVGQPQFDYEVKKFRNEAGAELFIPFVRGEPVYQAPPGYSEVSQEQQQQELADPTLPQATVESELEQTGIDSGMGGGPSVGDVGYSELSQAEQIGVGMEALGLGQSGAFGKGVAAAAPTAVGLGVSALGSIGTKGLGTLGQMGVEKVTGAPTAGSMAKAGVEKDIEDAKSKARSYLAMTPQQQAEVRGRSNQAIADRNQEAYMDAVGASQQMRDDAVGIMGTVGGVPTSLSVDVQTGTVVDTITGDVIGGRDRDAALSAVTLGMQEASFGDTSTGPDTSGPAETGSQAQASDPAETGVAESEAEADAAAEAEAAGAFKGGLIPKRKRKKKKKRSGLASR
jgi:hypothetical protein